MYHVLLPISLQALHASLLRHLELIWRAMAAATEDLTMMGFPQALRAARSDMARALDVASHKHWKAWQAPVNRFGTMEGFIRDFQEELHNAIVLPNSSTGVAPLGTEPRGIISDVVQLTSEPPMTEAEPETAEPESADGPPALPGPGSASLERSMLAADQDRDSSRIESTATPSSPAERQLFTMGFELHRVRHALEWAEGDVQAAANMLLS